MPLSIHPWTRAGHCAKGTPMFRCVHAAVALSLTSLAFGQATPSPTLKLTELAPGNLIKNASFEEPEVKVALGQAPAPGKKP
jgi:hypothetical protein